MKKDYDKLAQRLSHILIELNSGKVCDMKELAQEFGVTIRTLQRDINNRLNYLPLKRKGSMLWLEARLNPTEVQEFARIFDMKNLFPSEGLMYHVFNKTCQDIYMIRNSNSCKVDESIFKISEQGIFSRKKLSFRYNDKDRIVEPYKIMNQKGIWYLAGIEEKLKSFSMIKITNIKLVQEEFKIDDKILDIINKSKTQWLSGDTTEVTFHIKASVVEYFQRRELFPSQKILEILYNGDMILSAKFVDERELFSLVGYWLPNVKIISNEDLDMKFCKILKEYLLMD
jgi:predicted DNA-binding transcriptional regulator YafY